MDGGTDGERGRWVMDGWQCCVADGWLQEAAAHGRKPLIKFLGKRSLLKQQQGTYRGRATPQASSRQAGWPLLMVQGTE